MSRPWMPLYCEKFLTKTDHLDAIEVGAYLCLIMSYWIKRKLPQDDRSLARIARMTALEWAEHRESIASFFNEDWTHDKVEEELRKSDEAYEKRANAGSKGGKQPKIRIAKAENKQCSSNASSESEAGPNLKLIQSSNEDTVLRTGGDPPTPQKRLFDRAKEVLGPKCGGLVAKVLKVKSGNVALAMAAIEECSTMSNPAEWLGGVIRAGPRDAGYRQRSQTVSDIARMGLTDEPEMFDDFHQPDQRDKPSESAGTSDEGRRGFVGRLSVSDAEAARRGTLVDH